MNLFVISPPGLEEVVASELRGIGIAGRVAPGGVAFTGAGSELARANLHLRAASRVLARVAEFRARSFIELERHARRIDWSPFVGSDSRVVVRASSSKSKLYHERGIAERFGRWIAESCGAAVGSAPAGPEEEEEEESDGADQLVLIRFLRDTCTVSIDSSGEHLHRRGYRLAVGKAPLRENLAAAMLLGLAWNGTEALVDPMCGSGTIPIEAALIARRIAPGLANCDRAPREFAFRRWPSFDHASWDAAVRNARGLILDRAPVAIHGSDRDGGAIEGATANAARAGVGGDVQLEVRPLSAVEAPGRRGLLLTNPPYGVRVGEVRPLRDLYAAAGRLARGNFQGWRVGMLAADDGLVRQTRLELEEVLRTTNGGIPVRVMGTRG